MSFHKKIIDDMMLFSNFSNNHLCIVAAHWSRLCSRWLTSTWLLKSCNYSSLSSGLCHERNAFFFFPFFFLLHHAPHWTSKMNWARKHSRQTTKVCKSWTISSYDEKTLSAISLRRAIKSCSAHASTSQILE